MEEKGADEALLFNPEIRTERWVACKTEKNRDGK
jgi:hypothetical protein